MNDLVLNAMADRLLEYLRKNTDNPRDGLAVLGIAILKMRYGAETSLEEFAEDFKQSLIETGRDVSHVGPERVQ